MKCCCRILLNSWRIWGLVLKNVQTAKFSYYVIVKPPLSFSVALLRFMHMLLYICWQLKVYSGAGGGSYSVSRCVRPWIKLTPEYPFNQAHLSVIFTTTAPPHLLHNICSFIRSSCCAKCNLTWMRSITLWPGTRGKSQSFWWTACSSLQTSAEGGWMGMNRRERVVLKIHCADEHKQSRMIFLQNVSHPFSSTAFRQRQASQVAISLRSEWCSTYSGMLWSFSTGHQANTSQVLVAGTHNPVICPWNRNKPHQWRRNLKLEQSIRQK